MGSGKDRVKKEKSAFDRGAGRASAHSLALTRTSNTLGPKDVEERGRGETAEHTKNSGNESIFKLR